MSDTCKNCGSRRSAWIRSTGFGQVQDAFLAIETLIEMSNEIAKDGKEEKIREVFREVSKHLRTSKRLIMSRIDFNRNIDRDAREQ